MSVTKPVIVVGGGPVGLMLAYKLGLAGTPVLLLETEVEIPQDLRASTFHPPTLDMLDRHDGLGQELVERGLKTHDWQIRLFETGERALFDLSVLEGDTGHPYRLQCEQQTLMRLLRERLAHVPAVETRYGVTVTAIGQTADGVWAEADEERFAGSWLVGCDGARSVVRPALGIGFAGETYPETVLLATTDFDFAEALEGLSNVNYVWTEGGTFSLLRVPGQWRCSLYPSAGQSVEQALTPEQVEVKLQAIVPRPEPYRVLHTRSYRTHQRVAEEWRQGRILLAGDAAHINSPSGGMGMNCGLHDVEALAPALLEVLAGGDEGLLDRYVRRRRTIATEQVIAQADRNRKRMQERDPEARRRELTRLQQIVANRETAHAYMLESSMIAGLRRAETIA